MSCFFCIIHSHSKFEDDVECHHPQSREWTRQNKTIKQITIIIKVINYAFYTYFGNTQRFLHNTDSQPEYFLTSRKCQWWIQTSIESIRHFSYECFFHISISLILELWIRSFLTFLLRFANNLSVHQNTYTLYISQTRTLF